MMDAQQILKRPVLTEKSTLLKQERNQVIFVVDRKATKPQIKSVIEKTFNVKVLGVNTMINHGKVRRGRREMIKKPNWKKAIVTLREGDKIEVFEGV